MAREAGAPSFEVDGPTLEEAVAVLGAAPERVEPLVHSVRASTTAGVRRIVVGDRSAVVKLVRPRSDDPADPSRDPASFRWWRREVELLRGDALDPYRAAGLRPPGLLGIFERPGEALALWLEDVHGRPGSAWSLVDFQEAARRLGLAQGRVASGSDAGQALERPGLSRGFLREYLADVATRVPYWLLADLAAWRRPLVAERFPAGLREPLVRLHAEQARFAGWVAAAPPTLAHLDVWPNNLFAADDGLVLIDWAFAGLGGLGEDPGNLVLDSAWDLLHPAALLPDLDGAVWSGYLEGLREAGWAGDERRVRLAMCASAVKYDWLAPAMLERAADGRHVGYGGTAVEDPGRLFAERGLGLAFMLGWAEEARRLAGELGLG
jgi:hypothetical protein